MPNLHEKITRDDTWTTLELVSLSELIDDLCAQLDALKQQVESIPDVVNITFSGQGTATRQESV